MSRPPLILITKNGLGNRLRAIASALHLSELLRRELLVFWPAYDGAATNWTDLFDQPGSFTFIDSKEAESRGVIDGEIPRGLHESPDMVTLRGAGLGEQAFIRDFSSRAQKNGSALCVVVSGGYFDSRARNIRQVARLSAPSRRHLVQHLPIRSEILELAETVRPTGSYLGLHLRGTDRRKEAASPQRLINIAKRVAMREGVNEVFICADSDDLRASAAEQLSDAGLSVHIDSYLPTRRDVDGERHALADFVNLRSSAYLVGALASTFATEAATQVAVKRVTLVRRRSTRSRNLDRALRKKFGDSATFW